MLYVTLGFENGLTVDSISDSGPFVSAITQNELAESNTSSAKIFKNDDPRFFQFQIINGQFGKQ